MFQNCKNCLIYKSLWSISHLRLNDGAFSCTSVSLRPSLMTLSEEKYKIIII